MRTENKLTVFTMADGTTITTRSALEARWSIFFTLLGLNWKYEPIQLGDYIPDFEVEGLGLIEIKPTLELLISESSEKIKRTAESYPYKKIFCFVGDRVSFWMVAMYQGETIFAPTHQQMIPLIQKVATRLIGLSNIPDYIQTAMTQANVAKLDHFASVGKVIELQRIAREETAKLKKELSQ
jgi:hypothetical protein